MKIVLSVLKTAVAILVVLASIAGYLYYDSASLKRYCTSGVVGQTYLQVNSDVSKNELYLHRALTENTNRAVINNHASPFFRMACFIELESGVVKASKFGAGD
ncbi:hypothetical protein [Kangiella sp. M94]